MLLGLALREDPRAVRVLNTSNPCTLQRLSASRALAMCSSSVAPGLAATRTEKGLPALGTLRSIPGVPSPSNPLHPRGDPGHFHASGGRGITLDWRMPGADDGPYIVAVLVWSGFAAPRRFGGPFDPCPP